MTSLFAMCSILIPWFESGIGTDVLAAEPQCKETELGAKFLNLVFSDMLVSLAMSLIMWPVIVSMRPIERLPFIPFGKP